ncbi:hypothetical protein T440DRAFT_469631 [Plenodomus tracheiphilus IPT5]|uniref:Uncharacterized protein n=1 Tax=Plenodomus tracheiphilus IPT5 TaxID=1408161 RepID=A0A6A7B3I2_9PLEO|nr:hypothetical protein T440DRAFT_469631 [Plenodomus tracheiphilus IPT5]
MTTPHAPLSGLGPFAALAHHRTVSLGPDERYVRRDSAVQRRNMPSAKHELCVLWGGRGCSVQQVVEHLGLRYVESAMLPS